MTITALEWAAAATAVLGLLLSLARPRLHGPGFLAFVVSGALWIAFSWQMQLWGMAAMHTVFLLISAAGLLQRALAFTLTPNKK